MTPVLTPEYDYMGRRIRKTVKDGNQAVITDEKFCYDGWNLLAVINAANNNSTKTFLWGLDLSGSQQGAGGVGGLLSIWQSGDGSHFACYDGNGNVMKLISASSVTATANYEYSPFGDVVLATGTAATANPFRFSSKYQDDETGLLYYGYRYYIPGTGRWANRDPIEETGGLNLFAFVENKGPNNIDSLGQKIRITVAPESTTECGKWGSTRSISVTDIQIPYPVYVVQEITRTIEVKDCKGNVFYHEDQHYWEAWGPIPAMTPISEADNWSLDFTAGQMPIPYTSLGGSLPAGGSSGSDSMTGTVKVFGAFVTGVLASPSGTGWVPGGHPSAGDLMSTVNQPPWWNSNPSQGPTTTTVMFQWNCCNCVPRKSTTLTVF